MKIDIITLPKIINFLFIFSGSLFLIYFGFIKEITNIRFIYSIVFLLGILFHILFSIKNFEFSDFKKIGGIILFSLFAFIPGKSEYGYDIYLHIFLFFCIFLVLFTIKFAEKIINKISEIWVFFLTLGFWYICIFNVIEKTDINLISLIALFGLIGIFGTIIVIYSLFTKNNSDKNKLFLYVWFILILIFFGFIKLNLDDFLFFFKESNLNRINILNIFISGTIFSYILTYVVYLIQTSPFYLSKRETTEELEKRTIRFKKILINNFQDLQLNFKFILIIIIFYICLFFVDLYYFHFPNKDLVAILFVVGFFLEKIFNFISNKECQ